MLDPAPLTIVYRDEDAGLCIDCSCNVGLGPIGWCEDAGALCDSCLTARHAPFGMVLVTINIVREVGDYKSRGFKDDKHLMGLFLTMARLYAKTADKSWPRRPVGTLDDFRHCVDHPEEMMVEFDA